MQNEPRRRVETLFHAAREPRRRARSVEAYLDGACGDDAELRARVEALLAAHDEASGFLETPGGRRGPRRGAGHARSAATSCCRRSARAASASSTWPSSSEPVAPQGRAEDHQARAWTRKQVIARFEAERQALALMDHPNIAKVLDARRDRDRAGPTS